MINGRDMYVVVISEKGGAFPRTRKWGVVYLIRCPQSQDGNMRGGE
jgi:hypothetical protein